MHARLRHEALPYSGYEQFVSSVVTEVRDGLDRDERPIVLAEQKKLNDVEDALGDDVDEVMMVPTDEHGRNPSRVMTMLDGFRDSPDKRRMLGVTETVAAHHKSAAVAEAHFAESVLNSSALQMWAMSIICPYDVQDLDEACLLAMRRTHPVIRGESDANPDYDDRLAEKLYSAPLEPAPSDATSLKLQGQQLAAMRDFVRAEATGYGIAEDRVDDLVLAANEIGTNSLRHAGGRCTIRMWCDEGGSAVCEVSDGGFLRNPLLGRFAPRPNTSSGRGLWLSNHLCDLVQIRSSPVGTVVRLIVDP